MQFVDGLGEVLSFLRALRGEGPKPDTAEVQAERDTRKKRAADLVTVVHILHTQSTSV